MSITSRKAEYVSQHAPHSCKIWFICKGKLIKQRLAWDITRVCVCVFIVLIVEF